MTNYSDLKAQMLKDPEVSRYYKELGPEFAVVRAIIKRRLQKELTQAQLAKKIGTKQSAVARLESGHYNPSLSFLRKVASALDAELKISIS